MNMWRTRLARAPTLSLIGLRRRSSPNHKTRFVTRGDTALALATCMRYGFRERKEVMCSDRQYA